MTQRKGEKKTRSNAELARRFAGLSTPLLADASLRLGVELRLAPPTVRPVERGDPVAGCALPVRHYGSVDILLEAIGGGERGDILVIDNAGRLDEACIGDLTVLEAQAAGLAGIVVWGAHRDTAELVEIGLPVFSSGTCPAGPRRLEEPEPDALSSARLGEVTVTRDDAVFADQDGILFLPLERAHEALEAAEAIQKTERVQAEKIREGRTLQEQLRFAEYLAKRREDPSYTFRRHLRAIGGAIEE